MKLTSEDYRKLAEEIEKGSSTIEYEKGGETLLIDYTFESEGYFEDDYSRGTGAFVETYRRLSVNKVECWDENGEDTVTDFDSDALERQIA